MVPKSEPEMIATVEETQATAADQNAIGDETGIEDENDTEDETGADCENDDGEETVEGTSHDEEQGRQDAVDVSAESGEILDFVDVFGEHYQTEIREGVGKHPYDWGKLTRDGTYPVYEDENYTTRVGIDVSHHQGAIDWQAVKDAGVSFAFVRIGYRGYGQAGKLCPDKTALDNIREAQAVGIDVGCYFFSQAINEEEAAEEARFVLSRLKGITLELPVVYDPETIRDDVARTDDVSGEQFTKNTVVFSDMIREAGYEPMIYSNMLWEAFQYDLEELDAAEQLEIWYADYEPAPQTPYHFRFWQYTEKGKMAGVTGGVDLNLEFIPKH